MLDRIRELLDPHGLIIRGSFHPGPEDDLPGAAKTLVLIGNAGSALWRPFDEVRTPHDHALDIWTRELLEKIAHQLEAEAYFPFGGPPYHPFQRWAGKAEPGVEPSPIFIASHPVYGTWHAYRGALAFAEELDLPKVEPFKNPCAACRDKPCLTTCPVGAFDGKNYDVPACAAHVKSPQGEECLNRGCLARHACPVGRDYAYEPAHARFHMDAFIRARG